ncbi:MAG: nucleotidyltransferase family protein [Gemmatimonadetes bacterium]|nr:nucleotidyltransferase family protein [Gemmatimonadota bacterium]
MGVVREQSGGGSHAGPPYPASPLELPGVGRLSPEEQVVLLTARPSPARSALDAAAELSRGSSFSWARCFEIARMLWVHASVARAVLSGGSPLEPGLPSPIREQLRLAMFASTVRWRSTLRTLAPVLSAWREVGIRPALLKGVAVQAAWLPPGARLLNDVDLWVPTGRLDEACQILEAHGFSRSPVDLAAPPEAKKAAVARTWIKRGAGSVKGLSVDLHHQLLPQRVPCALSAEECAARGQTVSLEGIEVIVFSPEDSVVLLGGHLVKDTAVRLQTVADVVAFLEPGPPDGGPDFARLEARALESGAAASTSLALRWGKAAGAHVPEDVIRSLEATAPAARASNAVLVDARALFPRFRLRTVARGALGARYRLEGGRVRTAWSATLSGIRGADAWLGRGGLSSWYRMARSVPLVPAFLGAARLSAFLTARGEARLADRVNGLFWR